jgi:hypothetical protein
MVPMARLELARLYATAPSRRRVYQIPPHRLTREILSGLFFVKITPVEGHSLPNIECKNQYFF